MVLGDSGPIPIPGKGGIGPQGTVNFKNRIEQRKSMRRSVRAGSLKIKQTYEHFLENGHPGALSRMVRNSPHDMDIKLLQAKKQQAEMRRSVSFLPEILPNSYCIRINAQPLTLCLQNSKRGRFTREPPPI